ncbi:MAG: trehalose-phosphatase [Elusimicrobia bacterium]|nr:trehalose-phosphatase [Elusimicrobiota bacterium]
MAARIPATRRVLFLLDFDGTLCKTVPRPEFAKLPRTRREFLARLNRDRHTLAIITGRSLPDIREKVGLAGIYYGGDFGLEIHGPRCRFLHPEAPRCRPLLNTMYRRLSELVRDIPFAWVERKRWSLTVHHRRVQPRDLRRLRKRLADVREKPVLGLKWKRGIQCWEVCPDIAWDKGNAALLLWHRLGKPYAIAIGDNVADKPMFHAVADKGLALSVGKRRIPPASRRIKSVPEVYRFLARQIARKEPHALRHPLNGSN